MKKNMIVPFIMLLIIVLASCSASKSSGKEAGNSDAYPEKSIDLIVPFGAGGGTDQIARSVANALEKELGQPVVVTNKAAASGVVGSNEIASSDPNGYTLGVFSNTDVANFVYTVKEGVNFGLDDFTYLGGLNETGDILVVPKGSDIDSLDDFIKYSKENPGNVTVALPSKTQEMNITLMENEMDIELTQVVYESGNKVLADLIGGHIDAGILSAQFADQASDQGLKILGLMTEERLDTIEDVPTFTEQGYDVSNPAVRMLVGSADMPDDVVEKIEQALKEQYDGELAEVLSKMGEVPTYRNMDDLETFLEKDFDMREDILGED